MSARTIIQPTDDRMAASFLPARLCAERIRRKPVRPTFTSGECGLTKGRGAVHCLRGLFTNHVIESRAEKGILAAWNRSPSAASPHQRLETIDDFSAIGHGTAATRYFLEFLAKDWDHVVFYENARPPSEPDRPAKRRPGGFFDPIGRGDKASPAVCHADRRWRSAGGARICSRNLG